MGKQSTLVYAMFSALIAAVVAIYGCTEQKPNAAAKEEFFNYTLSFCSEKGEDCLKNLAELLSSAKESVKCAFYTADEHLIGNISARATEIVFDEKAEIAAAKFNNIDNASIYKSKSKGIMHNKYCIIDNSIVMTGSFNPTAAAKNDYNDLLVINSTSLAAFYNGNFGQLKGSARQKTAVTSAAAAVKNVKPIKPKMAILNSTIAEVYFCPEDGCAKAVKEKIRKANSSIVFAAYSFTHPEIANELIFKRAEGLAVAGVIEKSTTGSKYSKHSVMAANGIGIKLETSKRLLHYKFFVIDNETVITGSFNPTKNADERNYENVIIIRDKELANAYAKEFSKIFGDVGVQK